MLIQSPLPNPLVSDSRARRRFSLALLVAAAGLCAPVVLLAQPASVRPDALRKSKSVSEALALAGVVNPEPARQVLLDAPDIVVFGDLAQIRVLSRMPGTDWMMLLAEGHSSPVIEIVEFSPGEGRVLSAKIVLSHTTRLRAITRSAGRYFSVSREVKVAGVGCQK
jgi:predicted secreted protein